MSNTVKTLLAISLVAFVAACSKTEEPVIEYVEPEPTYNKV
ncbi:hypothetical protein [Harenicola maris]